MKLCIAGKNNIAVESLYIALEFFNKEDIVVILNQEDDKKNKWQKSLGFFAEKEGVKIVGLEDVYPVKDLIFLSLEFDKIIAPSKFATNKIYNLHFSLLPEYKGCYTSLLPILHGKNQTGVTFHNIDAGIDTGDIIFSEKIDISREMTCRDLYYSYIKTGVELIRKQFKAIISGDFIPKVQDTNNSTYFSRKSLSFDQKEIKAFQTAFQIKNTVNAFAFREYQMPTFKGKAIRKVNILPSKSVAKPGTVLSDEMEAIRIATIDFDVDLVRDYYDELISAVKNNDTTSLERVLPFIEDLNESDKNAWTPLIIACYNGSLESVKILLEAGAELHKTNLNLTTPFMYAKENALKTKNLELIRFLIDKGSDVYAKDIFGKTVIDYLDTDEHAFLINELKKPTPYQNTK
ncbi:MAG: hypothetical protein EA412_08675 [Chitinophagaceae bacterium]|nr:MAG: hypothetical protein EA412_08675 [Chitinophagaceae bacterium]